MYCCGEDRATKFCPECGNNLSLDPINALIAQCRATAKARQTEAEKQARRAASPEYLYKTLAKGRSEAALAQAAKWRSWADAVEALLKAAPQQVSQSVDR